MLPAALPPPVTNGAAVNVTCSPSTPGAWPTTGFNVSVTANGGVYCIGSGTNSVSVGTNTKPTITVTPRAPGPVCSDATTKVLTFNLSGLAPGAVYTISPAIAPLGSVNCTAPGNVTAGVFGSRVCSMVACCCLAKDEQLAWIEMQILAQVEAMVL